jgi:hypothetical protein
LDSLAVRPAQTAVDQPTGLTRPLSKLLGSQELRKHRATVAIELEVMAKKLDRFGWDRDRGSLAHDRMVTDWMDALQDYPLDEIKAACRAHVLARPRVMPNEGDIVARIMAARAHAVAAFKALSPAPSEPPRPRTTPEQAARILADAGFTPRRMGAAE